MKSMNFIILAATSLTCLIGFFLDCLSLRINISDILVGIDWKDKKGGDLIFDRIKELFDVTIKRETALFYFLLFLLHYGSLYYCNYKINSYGLQWDKFIYVIIIYLLLTIIPYLWIVFMKWSNKIIAVIVLLIIMFVFPYAALRAECKDALKETPYKTVNEIVEIEEFNPALIGGFMCEKYKEEGYFMSINFTRYYAVENNGLEIHKIEVPNNEIKFIYDDKETPHIYIQSYYRQYPETGEAVVSEEKILYEVYLPTSEEDKVENQNK